MEKIDIIKLMIQEKEEQEKSQTNFEEEKYIKLLHNYYDEYLHYNLLSLAKDGVISYNLNSKNNEEREQTEEIKQFVLHTIQNIVKYSDIRFDELSEKDLQVFEYLESQYSMRDDFYSENILNDFYQRKGNDNLDLLETKDKDYKKEVANGICNMLILRANTKQIKDFYKYYVIPILKDLYKENEIDFDITKLDDERTEKIRINILTTLSSFIIELNELTERIDIQEKDLPIFNFICSDDEKLKQAMALYFINQFMEIYQTKDFQDYLNSNKNGAYDIHIMTDKELEKHNELVRKYEMIEARTQEMFLCGVFNALNMLNKQKTITFDMSSNNKRIQKISKNIITFITKLFKEMALAYLDDEENNNNKTIGIMKHLFIDNTTENIDKKKELLTGIMNMFLHYYPKVDFEDDDYIENIELCIYSSKETTEEEVRERLIKMLEDKED